MKRVLPSVGIVVAATLVALGIWRARPRPPVVVGAVLPLTGDYARLGGSAARGIGLAMEEINLSGGVHRRRVEVRVEDSRRDPDQGLTAARRLIEEEGATSIIGAMGSRVTLAIAPLAQETETVLLSPASSAPAISKAGDFVFRNYPSDALQAALLAEHAFRQPCIRGGVLVADAADAAVLAHVFGTEFRARGGEIVYEERFEEPTWDFRDRLVRLGTADPDCVFIVGANPELRAIVTQAEEMAVDTVFYSPVIFHDQTAAAAAAGPVEGVVFSAPVFDPGSPRPEVADFTRRFTEKFGESPDIWAAHGYDALQLLVTAMRSHGVGGKQIRDGLGEIRAFEGAAGESGFDSNGDVRRVGRLLVVRGGELVLLPE